MRKIFLLLGLLVCFSGFSQNPDYHRFGARSKYYQPDTLSTTDRDALTPKLGTILYHKDTGVSQWEQWDGTNWVEFGAGSEYTFSDTAEIDLTLTGDDVTADIVAGSIDETKLDASVNASLDLADSANQVPRDSLIVQSPDSFGNIYHYWVGTEAQMDALILIDPNYFDNVLWFCTDCTEVVEVDWGNITGTLSDQTDLQSALNAKQATITGAASTIVSSDLTNNRALISNGSGKVSVSAVTSTELSYVGGVTSALQTQLNAKLNSSSYTAADVLSKLLTVDGSGSGLDADLLRGVHWGNVNTDIITSGNITATGSTAGNYLNIRKASTGSDTVGEFGNTTIDNGLQVVTDGNLDWGFNALNSRNLVFRTNQTERMRVTSGGIEVTGTASGSDPVNSDDFVTKGYLEESGTFTATIIDDGGGATYSASTNECSYYRVGELVFIQISIASINTTGAPSGNFSIGNLPFPVTTGQHSLNLSNFLGSSVSFYSIYPYAVNTEKIYFKYQNALDGNLNSTISSVTMTGGTISISGVYRSE